MPKAADFRYDKTQDLKGRKDRAAGCEGRCGGCTAGLIRRKDADKITVKDLVEVCGISRQTFYYHFKDIVDVVEWAAQQGVQRLVRESLNAATPQEALASS